MNKTIVSELLSPHAALPETGDVWAMPLVRTVGRITEVASGKAADLTKMTFRFISEPHVDLATLAADRMFVR